MVRLSALPLCILAVVLITPSCLRDEFWTVPSVSEKREERSEMKPAPAETARARDEKQAGGKKGASLKGPAVEGKESAVQVEKPQLPDYAGEAVSKGYFVPSAAVSRDARFATRFSGELVTEVPHLTRGKTAGGVVVSSITVPWLGFDRIQVYLYNNGILSPVDLAASPGAVISHSIVLGRGANYLNIAFMNGRSWVGRTPVVRAESDVQESQGRLELSWDGPGDLDLHIDIPAVGIHVGFDRPNHNRDGYRISLDADNMTGYGPESVRVFSIPPSTSITCYVNYYSGSENRRATVRHYDKNNRLVNTYLKTITPEQINGTPRFSDKSWLVDRITVGR